MSKFLMPVVFCIAGALSFGCSFSASSKSSSASSESLADLTSSPSVASSRSSETKKQGYAHDVRDYTSEFAKSSKGDLDSFRASLSKFAQKYGITNWEEDKSTYVAIGQGLKKAGLSQPQYEAFKASLAGSQPQKMEYIQEGYTK